MNSGNKPPNASHLAFSPGQNPEAQSTEVYRNPPNTGPSSIGSYSPSSHKSSPTHSTSGGSSPINYFKQLSLGSDRDGSSPGSQPDDSLANPFIRTSNLQQRPSLTRPSGPGPDQYPREVDLSSPMLQPARPSKKSKQGQQSSMSNYPNAASQYPSAGHPGSHQSSSHHSGSTSFMGGAPSGRDMYPTRSSSLPMPTPSTRSQTPFASRHTTPGSMSPMTRNEPGPSYQSAHNFQHGPTDLPPRPYNEGERPAQPKKPKGKIPGSAMEFLPLLERRFDRLEGAVEQYVEHRAQEALDRSILPGLDGPKPASTKQKQLTPRKH